MFGKGTSTSCLEPRSALRRPTTSPARRSPPPADDFAFAGVSVGYNNGGTPLTQANILSLLTTGGSHRRQDPAQHHGDPPSPPSPSTTAFQYGALDLGAMETALDQGGAVERIWLGTTTSGAINQLYFAPTLGASTDGVYRFGGGGTQGAMQIGVRASLKTS